MRARRLAVLALLFCAAAAGAQAPLATEVASVAIPVSDLDRSVAFYTDVLTFQEVGRTEVAGEAWERLEGVFGLRMRTARLRLGSEQIELVEYLAPEGRPVPADSRSNDLWFQHVAVIVSDMAKAYAHLRAHKVRHASSGPQRLPDWNRSAGGIEAFYFKDPDGHALEVLAFPPGKGDPRWQEKSRLFLGIDHTAIVVSDTEASLRFYRDALGLRVAGESENSGVEQEHLNNVFGARLRITGLRASQGPGIEFLQYLAPSDGRPRPAGTRANDLIAWQTRLRVGDASAVEKALRAGRAPFLSPGLVRVPVAEAGFAEALLVADPDGHQVQLVR
ncbi:MAG TPA: VOC family protein [Thermoanaerobaculia bacterium]|jgi:catechol 2,3-dioxygenase-like lactoylglutathione lyase family enzyme